ncbi:MULTISPECIES: DUF2267 domain-containing protein [Frankiaceae]|uniref:DUF2267 domain-containing protein n=1 Tax=Frankiaceae TaxID=74712 RepID=UPI0000543A09|nr:MULTISPECIES: DUF2267 domain-containing protein [Frankiaceae]ABW13387.1 conserved hypothetical protein [Frankia sp. EAN1pec]CAI7976618.1 conserved hypothetical protein [Frankia sp. Hr75.2]SQD96872.1 conserved hypothetical protein [Parafrankia sp. Ea1.12]
MGEVKLLKQDEIVSAVRGTARIDSVEHAEAAVRATLSVLGERLSGGETKDLASQLPSPFAQALPPAGRGERFGLDEFYRRVAEREGEGCDEAHARQHARAVVAALKASISPDEFEDVAGQLPSDYADLLGREPVIHY